jgi:hypothetical protein
MTLYNEIQLIIDAYPSAVRFLVWSGEPDLTVPGGIMVSTWEHCTIVAFDADDNPLFGCAPSSRG